MAEALIVPQPPTEARTSRLITEVLLAEIPPSDARVSRVASEVLVTEVVQPWARVSRAMAEALVMPLSGPNEVKLSRAMAEVLIAAPANYGLFPDEGANFYHFEGEYGYHTFEGTIL